MGWKKEKAKTKNIKVKKPKTEIIKAPVRKLKKYMSNERRDSLDISLAEF